MLVVILLIAIVLAITCCIVVFFITSKNKDQRDTQFGYNWNGANTMYGGQMNDGYSFGAGWDNNPEMLGNQEDPIGNLFTLINEQQPHENMNRVSEVRV